MTSRIVSPREWALAVLGKAPPDGEREALATASTQPSSPPSSDLRGLANREHVEAMLAHLERDNK